MQAVKERAQFCFEHQRGQGKTAMTHPNPAMLAGPAPASTLP
jgi:hypothetical protein